MKLLLLTLLTIGISNSIKFVIFLVKGGRISSNSFFWYYVWAGKFPSTHSAALGTVMYGIWYVEGASSLFAFSVVVSAVVIYTLIENKKRYELLEAYYVQSADGAIKSIVSDRRLAEFEGHTIVEVAAGLLLGIFVAVVFFNLIV